MSWNINDPEAEVNEVYQSKITHPKNQYFTGERVLDLENQVITLKYAERIGVDEGSEDIQLGLDRADEEEDEQWVLYVEVDPPDPKSESARRKPVRMSTSGGGGGDEQRTVVIKSPAEVRLRVRSAKISFKPAIKTKPFPDPGKLKRP
ncbi:MAG: hypothetical protein IPF41_12330 [Flavobacteriales bacterium]|nr:hypothetical protein [Flavobacteriales bacterium]